MLQAAQLPVQALLQQVPSAQKPLVQSLALWHGTLARLPIGFLGDTLARKILVRASARLRVGASAGANGPGARVGSAVDGLGRWTGAPAVAARSDRCDMGGAARRPTGLARTWIGAHAPIDPVADPCARAIAAGGTGAAGTGGVTLPGPAGDGHTPTFHVRLPAGFAGAGACAFAADAVHAVAAPALTMRGTSRAELSEGRRVASAGLSLPVWLDAPPSFGWPPAASRSFGPTTSMRGPPVPPPPSRPAARGPEAPASSVGVPASVEPFGLGPKSRHPTRPMINAQAKTAIRTVNAPFDIRCSISLGARCGSCSVFRSRLRRPGVLCPAGSFSHGRT